MSEEEEEEAHLGRGGRSASPSLLFLSFFFFFGGGGSFLGTCRKPGWPRHAWPVRVSCAFHARGRSRRAAEGGAGVGFVRMGTPGLGSAAGHSPLLFAVPPGAAEPGQERGAMGRSPGWRFGLRSRVPCGLRNRLGAL